jgi:hypothetical protein
VNDIEKEYHWIAKFPPTDPERLIFQKVKLISSVSLFRRVKTIVRVTEKRVCYVIAFELSLKKLSNQPSEQLSKNFLFKTLLISI